MRIDLTETISQAIDILKRRAASKGRAEDLETYLQLIRTQFEPRIQSVASIRVVPHDNGFFANFLQVLDVLTLKAPSASVYVDWSPIDNAAHFTYHREGNLWDRLFHPLGTATGVYDVEIKARINPLLGNVYKGIYWDMPVFERDRQCYHEAFSSIRIKNERIMQRLSENRESFASRHVVGVHKRVSNPGTEAMQQGSIPSNATCIEKVSEYTETLDSDYIVYLATDDLDAVEMFDAKFGSCVHYLEDATRVRGGVQQCGTDSEVHRLQGGASLKDAEDVVIDVWSLAMADCLWHVNSSNIPLAASFMNAAMPLFSLAQDGR